MKPSPPPSAEPGWFWRGLAVQSNVVGALLMRELHTRYGRDNIGYLWMIGEPMFLAIMVALIHVGKHVNYGMDIRPVPFVVIGYCFFISFSLIVNRAEGALEGIVSLMYHRMVTILDIQLARTLLEGAATLMTLALLLTLAALTGLADWPVRPLQLIVAALLMIWFSFGVSLLVCALTYENPTAGRFVHPITYILFPISGGFYMLEWIPDPYRSWLYWFPMTQIFEMARYGQFVAADDQYFSIFYILAACVVLSFLGMLAIRLIRQHIHLR